MSTVKLGRTGIVSDKNAFGALPIQRVDAAYAGKLLRKAYDAGWTYFDTARGYSDSEEKIGLAMSDIRDKIVIATKTMSFDADGFWEQLHTSLKKLKTDYIDVYQFHNPGYVPRPGDSHGLYDAMLKAKEQGKVRYIGITNHRLPVAEEAVRSGLYDTLQFPFSYLAGDKDLALVKLCEELGVGFVCMKALSGGLITSGAAAYAWLNTVPNALPIWGVQRESELDEFISFSSTPPTLTGEIEQTIARDRKELAGEFCRGCGYCMPGCPAQIQVATAARMIQLIRRSPSAGHLSEQGKRMMRQVNECVDCGQCKQACPYGLDTPTLLRKNLKDFEAIVAGKVTI
ncbi:MAG: aldo/keto reductase [Oscillospiraceae bacterium]|jgi:aryl-alcohol dehydrogenase-like predicted oxidoreductase|nr:aldo/keto reductase [Oscillospiraceae bacterium]